MSGLMTVLWFFQSLALFIFAALCLLVPERLLDIIWGGGTFLMCQEARVALAGQMRMLAPLAIGTAMFIGAASMREDELARRSMARSVSILLGLQVLFLVSPSITPDVHTNGALLQIYEKIRSVTVQRGATWSILAGISLILFLLQTIYGFTSTNDAIAPRRPGIVDTKPPTLWLYWSAQGVGLVGAGFAQWAVHWDNFSKFKFTAQVAEKVQGLPAGEFLLDVQAIHYVGVGFCSFYAIRLIDEWSWRFLARIFAIFAGAWILTFLFVHDLHNYRPQVLLLLLLVLLMFVANVVYLRKGIDPIAEDFGLAPDGWTLLDLPSGPLLGLQSLISRRRATHLMGVAVRGRFTVVSKAKATFPPNKFFKYGRSFPMQARFATLTSCDDASNDIRGASIRLASDVEVPSSFDMLMNTGSVAGPNTMVLFTLGVILRFLPDRAFEYATKWSRPLREALIAGRRRAPDSFATLHYYSQVVRFWVDNHDQRWLVRYRLVNADPEQKETGLPDEDDCKAIWIRERRPHELRPSNYLRDELRRRLAFGGKPIKLMFQAQFHKPRPGDTLDWYNSGVDWPNDDDAHKWKDLAVVTLEEPLTEAQAERIRFNANNHPPTLGIPTAPNWNDYRSLADSERRVIRRLATFRHTMYRLRGLPKFGNTLPTKDGNGRK